MSSKEKAARRAEDAVMAWLRGDVDQVVLTRNPDGSRHVGQWQRANPQRRHMDSGHDSE
jgi:hypothetical protein